MKYRFEPVPGKEFTFFAIDKETGEKLDITAKLEAGMKAGAMTKGA